MASELAWILGGYSVVMTMAAVMLWRRMFDAECELEWKERVLSDYRKAYHYPNPE